LQVVANGVEKLLGSQVLVFQ